MSHCWPRSHSPVGTNVVFFKPRALPRQAFLLLGGFHISFYFPVLYIITSTIHIDPVMLAHTIPDRGGRKRGKTESQS